MRLLLNLELVKTSRLPLHYHYLLSSAIYKLLKFGSPEFAACFNDIDFNPKMPSLKIHSVNLSSCINTSVKIMEGEC